MKHSKSLKSNSVILTITELLTVLYGIGLIVLLARMYGAEKLGVFSLAMSLGTVLSLLTFQGINDYLIREVSRFPDRAMDFFIHLGLSRSIFTLAAMFILEFFTYSFTNLSQHREVLYVIILTRLFDSLQTTCYAFFRAQQIMRFEAYFRLSNMGSNILAISFLSIVLNGSFLSVMKTLCAISIFFLVAAALFLHFHCLKDQKIKEFTIRHCLFFLKKGWTVSSITFLALIYVHFNTIFLSFIHGERSTGIYTASFRFISAFGFVAAAIAAASFPVMSNLKNDFISLGKTYQQLVKILFIIGLLISTILLSNGKHLIIFVYGKGFSDSFVPLYIMAATPTFMFLNAAHHQLLVSQDKEKQCLKIFKITLLLSISLNLLLIPLFKEVGASLTTLVPELFLSLLYIVQISKWNKQVSYQQYTLPLIACLIYIPFGIYIATYIHVVFAVILSLLIPFSLMFVFNVFNESERNTLFSLFINKHKSKSSLNLGQ